MFIRTIVNLLYVFCDANKPVIPFPPCLYSYYFLFILHFKQKRKSMVGFNRNKSGNHEDQALQRNATPP